MTKSMPGYTYAILAAVLFGAGTPAAKWLLSGVSPLMLAGLLYLGSGIGLLAVRVVHGRGHARAPLRGKDWLWLGGATLFGGVLAPFLLMAGLARTDAASASLLLNLEGVFTAALAWFAFRENFDRRIVLGMLAIVAGSIALSWGGAPDVQSLVGPLCIVGACAAWGVDNNLTKQIAEGDALQIATIKGLVAGATNTLLALYLSQALPTPKLLAFAGLVGFFSYGISLLCFVLGLRHIGAARTGAYFSLAPFIGAVATVALGWEPMTWQLAAAGALMGLGVWLHLTEQHAHEHIHEEMEHEHGHVHDEHHQHEHLPGDPPGEPHSHVHRHQRLVHAHPHFPDAHHTHAH